MKGAEFYRYPGNFSGIFSQNWFIRKNFPRRLVGILYFVWISIHNRNKSIVCSNTREYCWNNYWKLPNVAPLMVLVGLTTVTEQSIVYLNRVIKWFLFHILYFSSPLLIGIKTFLDNYNNGRVSFSLEDINL